MRRPPFRSLPLLAAVVLGGCATLGQALGVGAPSFTRAEDRSSLVRLELPRPGAPRGTATVVLWTRVENPNDFGFTLSTLRGDLHLEGRPFADVDLPLGLALPPRGDTVLPLEIRVPVPDLDRLGDLGRTLLTGGSVGYRLEGVVGVDAGPLGEPTFGPRTWLEGALDVQTGLAR